MRIIYFGFSRSNSIDSVYIKGMREQGVTVDDFFYPDAGWRRYVALARAFFDNRKDADIAMVGYASPQAVIWLWLLGAHHIIYNALCSEYERKIVSRGLARTTSVKAFYYWLLDYLACFCSKLVMLETQHQIDYFIKIFHLKPGKLFLAWTGVDDRKFSYRGGMAKFETFTVLFRGRLLPEAGGTYLVRAAKELENQPIDILMLAAGQELTAVKTLIGELKPKRLKLVTEFLPDDELLTTMERCHLSLGQLGNHDRLQRTIPHKAYESIALKLPYLTARNPAVMELMKENETCLAFNPADSHDLAQKILWAKDHQAELVRIADASYELYQKKLTTSALAAALLDKVKAL
jgi:glycosyltransferase involved in cell wall biosynthesis